jgi:hypothetical protein
MALLPSSGFYRVARNFYSVAQRRVGETKISSAFHVPYFLWYLKKTFNYKY